MFRNCADLAILSENIPPAPPSPSALLGINLRREEVLHELMNRTNYNIIQRNGQRIYGSEVSFVVG
jgi:hypothetical protein